MRNSTCWTPKEDQALKILTVERHIRKWSQISKILAQEFEIYNKNPKKCRQRFNNHINPQINRQSWTEEEQNLLMFHQNSMGNKWSEIARKIPGRTDNFVKNKFYSKLRHAIRKINQLSYKCKIQKYKQISISFMYKIVAVIDYKFKHQTNNLQENLIQLAQKIKNDIVAFENIDVKQGNNYQVPLTELFKNIQLINTYFKKKIYKRKKSKFSEIIKNCDHIQNVQLEINQKNQINEQKAVTGEEEKFSCMINQAQAEIKKIVIEKSCPQNVKVANPKAFNIISASQINQDQSLENLCPEWMRIPICPFPDPWGTHYFEQNFEYDSL